MIFSLCGYHGAGGDNGAGAELVFVRRWNSLRISCARGRVFVSNMAHYLCFSVLSCWRDTCEGAQWQVVTARLFCGLSDPSKNNYNGLRCPWRWGGNWHTPKRVRLALDASLWSNPSTIWYLSKLGMLHMWGSSVVYLSPGSAHSDLCAFPHISGSRGVTCPECWSGALLWLHSLHRTH